MQRIQELLQKQKKGEQEAQPMSEHCKQKPYQDMSLSSIALCCVCASALDPFLLRQAKDADLLQAQLPVHLWTGLNNCRDMLSGCYFHVHARWPVL